MGFWLPSGQHRLSLLVHLTKKKKVVTWQCAQKKALVFGPCLPFVKTIRSLVTHVFFKGETGSDV